MMSHFHASHPSTVVSPSARPKHQASVGRCPILPTFTFPNDWRETSSSCSCSCWSSQCNLEPCVTPVGHIDDSLKTWKEHCKCNAHITLTLWVNYFESKNPAANADDNLWYAHVSSAGDVFYDYSLAGLQHLLSFCELVCLYKAGKCHTFKITL